MTEILFEPGEELTFATVEACRKKLLACYSNNAKLLINIHLNAVTHCDSAGLALLIEAKRLAAQFNQPSKITAIPENIQVLAQFCGAEKLFID